MAVTSVIAGLKAYLLTWSGFDDNRPLSVDSIGAKGYSLVPAPSPKVIETYLNGTELRSYDFALQSAESTADELQRIANSSFFETFEKWIKDNNQAGTFPEVPTKHTVESIECLQAGAFLIEQGQSDTGVYQIQCRMTYELSL